MLNRAGDEERQKTRVPEEEKEGGALYSEAAQTGAVSGCINSLPDPWATSRQPLTHKEYIGCTAPC